MRALSSSQFDRAAKLAAIPAGASPANIRRSSHCCSYIQQRRGRPIRYGLSGCWPPCTNLTGLPANGGFYFQAFDSRENRARREANCGTIGSAEHFGPLRRPMSTSVFWTETMIDLPEVIEDGVSGRNGPAAPRYRDKAGPPVLSIDFYRGCKGVVKRMAEIIILAERRALPTSR
jgi:hypothetical protein